MTAILTISSSQSLYLKVMESIRYYKEVSKKETSSYYNLCKAVYAFIDYTLEHENSNLTTNSICASLAKKLGYKHESSVRTLYDTGYLLNKYPVDTKKATRSAILRTSQIIHGEFFKRNKKEIIEALNSRMSCSDFQNFLFELGFEPRIRISKIYRHKQRGLSAIKNNLKKFYKIYLKFCEQNGEPCEGISLYLYDTNKEQVIMEFD